MTDPKDAIIGQLFMAGQEFKDKLEYTLAVLRQVKQGELPLERLIMTPDGFTVLPEPPQEDA